MDSRLREQKTEQFDKAKAEMPAVAAAMGGLVNLFAESGGEVVRNLGRWGPCSFFRVGCGCGTGCVVCRERRWRRGCVKFF